MAAAVDSRDPGGTNISPPSSPPASPGEAAAAQPAGGAGGRPLRADARRNRARVLDAAETVFAAKGTGASTEEIAQAAGVGIGTLFRHFPTKEQLLEAVFVARLQRLARAAGDLASADDPGAALTEFFTRAVSDSATKLAYTEALAGVGVDVDQATSAVGQELLGALDTLLDRAQHAGAVRGDVGVGDLTALFVGATRAAEHAGWDPEAQARILAVILDGLRPR